MTRGTNSLAKRPEEVTSLWTTHGQGATDDTRKSPTPDSSMMGRPDQ